MGDEDRRLIHGFGNVSRIFDEFFEYKETHKAPIPDNHQRCPEPKDRPKELTRPTHGTASIMPRGEGDRLRRTVVGSIRFRCDDVPNDKLQIGFVGGKAQAA